MIFAAFVVPLCLAFADIEPKPGPVERFGVSTAIAHPDLTDLLRSKNPAYATVREGSRFGYRFAVAPGAARVTYGVSDFIMAAAGQRVFDVVANNAVARAGVDVIASGGGYPDAFEDTFAVDVAADGKLELRFDRQATDALVAWIRVVDAAGVEWFVDCGGADDVPTQNESAKLGEAVVACHGSRFFLDLRPQWREVTTSPLGMFAEGPKSAALGFAVKGTVFSLPLFKERRDWKGLDETTETRSATGIEYALPLKGYDARIIVRTPFDPSDRALWSLPVITIDFIAKRTDPAQPEVIAGVFFLELDADATTRKSTGEDGLVGVVASRERNGRTIEHAAYVRTAKGPVPEMKRGYVEAKDGFLRAMAYVDTVRGDNAGRIMFVGYDPGPALDVEGTPHAFLYARAHASIDDVAAFAVANEQRLLRGSDAIAALFRDATWPAAVSEFAAYALPSYALDTWWTQAADGTRFTSVHEGFCRYHSTLDVAYNAAPWSLWFAPDQLRADLVAWPRVAADGVLPHDLGHDDHVGAPAYDHEMPVEENTNFVLLLYAYVLTTGDVDVARELLPALRDALAYLERCDTDGDGSPDVGVANTLDDAPAALQFARGQTYLTVKVAAAFEAAAALARLLGESALATAWDARTAHWVTAVEERAYLGSHYAAAIDGRTAGLVDPWRRAGWRIGVDATLDCLPGADLAHPYTTLGLPWLLHGGGPLLLDPARVRIDLRAGFERCKRPFGSTHGERSENVWVSQNLFRDATCGYLGEDVLDRFTGYTALQHWRARVLDERDCAGFCDSPYNRALSYYPRGVAFILTLEAAAGMKLDRVAHTLLFKPVRAPFTLPLPSFAAWKDMIIPKLIVTRAQDGSVDASIEHRERLAGMAVTIDLSLLGGGVKKL